MSTRRFAKESGCNDHIYLTPWISNRFVLSHVPLQWWSMKAPLSPGAPKLRSD